MIEVARAQHWLLTTPELTELGFDNHAVARLVDERILQRVIRGLYRVHGTRSPTQDVAAALSRHAGSAASHRSGAFLHELAEVTPAKPDFTVPIQSTGGTTLGTLHRSALPDEDLTIVQGLRVTTVSRTIVDVARYLSQERMEEALNVAISGKMASVESIIRCARRLEHEPGRDGHARLRKAMAGWTDPIRPDTPAEAAVFRRIAKAGLPLPETQYTVLDPTGAFVARVDLAWPEEKVIREYDSDLWHRPEHVERDELRKQRLEALDWDVDVIARPDLRPSARKWLEELRRDLSRAVRRAS